MNVYEIFGRDRPWDGEKLVRFWGDLHSDLELLFRLRLFSICKIALLNYCVLCVHTIMPAISMISLILLLCISLTLQTKIYSLVEVRTLSSLRICLCPMLAPGALVFS